MKHLVLETPEDEKNLEALFVIAKNSISLKELPILTRLISLVKEMPKDKKGKENDGKIN